MRTAVKAVVIFVVLVITFLFVPVFPYTAASGSAFGVASVRVTADVSLTFLLFHCGSFINAQITGLSPVSRGLSQYRRATPSHATPGRVNFPGYPHPGGVRCLDGATPTAEQTVK